MPADIRNFFGGGRASQRSQKQPTPAKTEAKKKPSRAARVIEDSEDDEEVLPKKPTPKKLAPKKKAPREPSPEGIETTTSAFFGSKNKPRRSEPAKPKKAAEPVQQATPKATPQTPVKKTNGRAAKPATPASRASGRVKKVVNYSQQDDDDYFDDDDLDEGDIFEADFAKNGKGKDDYVKSESSEDDDDIPIALPHRATPRNTKQQPKAAPKIEDTEDEDIDMEDAAFEVDDRKGKPPAKSAPAAKSTPAGRKRKSPEDDDEVDTPKRGRPKKPAGTQKSPAKKRAKKEDIVEDAAIQAIYDSIPTVRPPTPPPPGKKFDWRAAGGNAAAGPAGGSSEDMPTGAENCLAGLTFVFTGVLSKWGRPEATELVKLYGGKVTTAPSKNTKYVVLGTDAGPSKLQKIRDLKIKTINEEGLSQLIRTLPPNGGDSKAADAYKEKQRKEQEKILQQAEEMERVEKEERKAAAKAAAAASAAKGSQPVSTGKQAALSSVDSRLWTTKYAPNSLGQICGNKAAVEKLQRWLNKFPKNLKTGFKLAGADGSGVFRAVLISGPPGIGKTTAAHLVAKLEGYDIVEFNASDTRSKKLMEEGLRGVLNTTSLNGYFAGDGQQVQASKKKLVIIMDEVDGMSAGDRGGVGALAAICKKSEIPMILICNESRIPKMKPFNYVTYDLPFKRPTVDQIRSRIMTIAFREGLKMPPPVVNALIEGSRSDIRQVVNMISTAKLDQAAMDFNKGKEMSKNWEKHIILKPWDITNKILGGGMFADSSKATLNEKIELYFNDHEFSPLMLQENYLGTNPIQALGYQGKERDLKLLELAEKASESISDGDLVDRMIHGSQQHWSLMPTHAVFSFVRPASYVAGSLAGHQTEFTSWLGKNSAQQKLTRYVKEIQSHMRLRCSGDRHEVRQQYIPMLWTQLVQKLELEGKEAVPEIIDFMDSYFLTKEDFDAIMELGVGPMNMEYVKLETQAKSTFTRLYNQQSHPLPFMKASQVVAPKRMAKEKPDLEEAIDESDEGEVVDEVKEDDEDVDLSKDKYVKQPKKKAVAKKAAPKAAPKSKKKMDVDSGDESEEVVKPKGRGRGKAPAAAASASGGRGRGRGRGRGK